MLLIRPSSPVNFVALEGAPSAVNVNVGLIVNAAAGFPQFVHVAELDSCRSSFKTIADPLIVIGVGRLTTAWCVPVEFSNVFIDTAPAADVMVPNSALEKLRTAEVYTS